MRQFIQIAATGTTLEDFLYAIADDGTVWRLDDAHVANLRSPWKQLRSAPQGDSPQPSQPSQPSSDTQPTEATNV